MTAIWFILAFMTAAAVFALLWPLSRRGRADGQAPAPHLATETGFYEDQLAEIERDLARGLIAPPEAEAARTEAARRLLRASREEGGPREGAPIAEPHLRQRRAAAAFALSTIPLVALLAYGLYGSPNLPSQTEADRKAAQSGGQDLMKAVGQIEAKLASDPNDARGWSVLAPVYMRLGRFDDAARAYEAVVRLQGEDVQRLSDWGEALVAAGQGAVSPEARTVLERALALDPNAAKPTFYLARGDEQAGDPASAIRRLDALMARSPADAPWLPLVRETLARLKGEPAPQAAPEAAPGKEATQGSQPGSKPGSNPGSQAESPADGQGGPAASGPAANVQSLPAGERMDAIRGMVEGLDRRLDKQGGTAEEWGRLVRSHSVLGQRDKALAALERGRTALKGDPPARAQLDAQARTLGLDGAEPRQAPAAKPEPARPGAGIDSEAAAAAVRAMPQAERDAAIRGMVAGLDRRLAAKGGNMDEWMRLVRSYAALGDRANARQALDRARMALAADAGAVERLDELDRELGLKGAEPRP